MTSFWLHPSLVLILGALVLPLVPARLKKGYLLLIPILLFARILTLARGEFGRVHVQQWTLVFGRVDALSSVFGYIMSLMCILGTLYGLHVKDDAQHIASWFYVAGSVGCIYAGDFITLFLFWELMAFSSVFLIWFRGRRESLWAGYRYLLVHIVGGVVLLGGIVLHCNAPGNGWSFNLLDVHHPTTAIYLIMAGFILNAAVPPLHAWLPDAYGEATFNGSVFMCAFTTKTAVYALCRGFAGMEILVPLGVIMALYGVVYAVLENDCRRLLAYHIISQVGYMVAGVGLGTQMAINRACVRAHPLQGPPVHGLRRGAAHDRPKQVHGAGRAVEEDALDVCLHSHRRLVDLRLPALQRVCQQVHDRQRRVRGAQVLGRLPALAGLRGDVSAHRAEGALLHLVRKEPAEEGNLGPCRRAAVEYECGHDHCFRAMHLHRLLYAVPLQDAAIPGPGG